MATMMPSRLPDERPPGFPPIKVKFLESAGLLPQHHLCVPRKSTRCLNEKFQCRIANDAQPSRELPKRCGLFVNNMPRPTACVALIVGGWGGSPQTQPVKRVVRPGTAVAEAANHQHSRGITDSPMGQPELN
jgi:hypothetical protein